MGKENYEQYLIWQLEHGLKNLKRRCLSLSNELGSLASQVDKKGIDTFIDSCGVVQIQGLKIDLLCMKIHMLQRELALYKSEGELNDKTKTG